jgi:cytochrome c553
MAMSVRRMTAFAVLAVGAIGVVVLSGVVPIKASSGHWPITAWLLDFVKRRSVATHSIGIATPPLDDPALILKGAGHYESGCRPCHGSPGTSLPKIPAGMTPHPPDIRAQVSRWEPAELFYIVKHGIKFTGMPAWPSAHRDDEVWAIVGFLRTLPRLDGAGYARSVFGDLSQQADRGNAVPMTALADSPEPSPMPSRLVADRCARCHGVDGKGRENAAFPRLAHQRPEYLRSALEAYARGTRHSGIMAPIAASLDADMIGEASAYYAGLAPFAASSGAAVVSDGATIAARGVPSADVPPCAECHGPVAGDRNPAYPILAGQFPEYLRLQLRLFAENRRGGGPYAHVMQGIASRLTAGQINDVAAYYGSLPPLRDP